MKEQALKKLRDEMAAKKDDDYVQVIGEFLVRHVESNPESAEKILAEDKTIEKSIVAMEDEAKKKANGKSRVMLTESEGYAIVLKYFDIASAPDGQQIPTTPAHVVTTSADNSTPSFNLKLGDYM